MRPVAAGLTDVGKERDHNEDRFILLPEYDVFVVADGMGGHQCGEVASRLATSTIANYFRLRRANEEQAGDIPDVLRASLLEANEQIHRRAKKSAKHRGMGTTVVAAAVHRDAGKLYVAHAGDSRCYRFRDGKFDQLTRDHSLVEEALRTRPDISESELAYLPGNVITRALGVEPAVDVELTIDRIEIGDIYLLCSDGLHGYVADARIAEIVATERVLTRACAALIDEANDNGGGDNITAVLVLIEKSDDPWRVATSVPPPPPAGEEHEESLAALASLGRAKTIDPDDTVETGPLLDADGALVDTQQLKPVRDPDRVLADAAADEKIADAAIADTEHPGPPDEPEDESDEDGDVTD
jgi:protein phosphatase